MSFDAITWALEHSPVNCPYERLILTCLARRANADGTDAYPSRRSLAAAGLADKSTVTRKLNALEKRGIIREGDQRAAARIPEYLRPKVYDVLIPFSYYSADQLERVNRERNDRGLPPLTPASRPDIAPAPERKVRADKGKKKTSKKEGGASSTPLPETPSVPDSDQFEGGASSTRVLEVPEGGASSTPKLSFNSVLSPVPSDPASTPVVAGGEERREEKIDATPPPAPAPETKRQAAEVADAWVASRDAHGHAVPGRSRFHLLKTAAELLAEGHGVDYLVAAAADMGSRPTWFDLAKHLITFPDPTKASVPAQRPAHLAQDAIAACPDCDPYGWLHPDDDGPSTRCTHAHSPALASA